MTSLVPSGNVPSTCTSVIIAGTPAITWLRPRNWRPRFINSATLLAVADEFQQLGGDQRDGFGMV